MIAGMRGGQIILFMCVSGGDAPFVGGGGKENINKGSENHKMVP